MYSGVKRVVDLVSAIFVLLITAPLCAGAAVAVWVSMGTPILFSQLRAGRDGAAFRLYKFRTMREVSDGRGRLLPDQERLSAVGAFLRRTSLDELPQLINVLRGEMSLIGPRPLFVRYLPYYTERERRRHEVRPGITGLAQVSGRNQLLWDDRLELDVQYVENCSFWLDAQIIVRTVGKILKGSDVMVIPGLHQPPLDVVRAAAAAPQATPDP